MKKKRKQLEQLISKHFGSLARFFRVRTTNQLYRLLDDGYLQVEFLVPHSNAHLLAGTAEDVLHTEAEFSPTTIIWRLREWLYRNGVL